MTGVEVAVGVFFNGKEFIYPLNGQFRAQEALSRQHRSVNGRNGHGDVLERP